MANTTPDNDNVKIFEPDRSLQIKIGVPNLDSVFTSKAIMAAQCLLDESSEALLDDTAVVLDELSLALDDLETARTDHEKKEAIDRIVASSFGLKTKAGQGGYDLLSRLAKSLQLYAEQAQEEGLPEKGLMMIGWFIQSLGQVAKLRIKGDGGMTGQAILMEVEHITTQRM